MSEIDTEEDISMNKTQLKNFAVAARVALIERVKDRARGFGIDEKTCAGGAVIPSKMVQTLGGALLSQTEINQRDALLARIQSRGYDQVMEETAYTWFNRFIALRYMQEHNLLPVSVRVLPDAPGALPELVRQAQNVELDGVGSFHVVELLEGNRTETLYTELLIALCNQLSVRAAADVRAHQRLHGTALPRRAAAGGFRAGDAGGGGRGKLGGYSGDRMAVSVLHQPKA